VYLRPDRRVLEAEQWPTQIRQPGVLDRCQSKSFLHIRGLLTILPDFDLVEAMLEPQVYPEKLPALRKYQTLQKQAKSIGLRDRCSLVPLTTAFHHRTNATGVEVHASTLSGQDSLGLNDGSKNTVLATYLADAWCHGAEM
jgi:hypothetical protein